MPPSVSRVAASAATGVVHAAGVSSPARTNSAGCRKKAVGAEEFPPEDGPCGIGRAMPPSVSRVVVSTATGVVNAAGVSSPARTISAGCRKKAVGAGEFPPEDGPCGIGRAMPPSVSRVVVSTATGVVNAAGVSSPARTISAGCRKKAVGAGEFPPEDGPWGIGVEEIPCPV